MTFKFLGIEINLDGFKPGIRRNGLDKNTKLLSIFDKIDKENEQGLKDGVIDREELSDFINQLLKQAKDNNLSKKEAVAYLKSQGLNNITETDLMVLLNYFKDSSEKIESTSYDSKRGITTIEYKEGYIEEVGVNGIENIASRVKKDNNLKDSVATGIPFHYIADDSKNWEIQRGLDKDIEKLSKEETAMLGRVDKSSGIKEYYPSPDDKKVKSITYKDKSGKVVHIVNYDIEDNTKISSIMDFDGKNWKKLDYKPDYGSFSISVLSANKETVITESFYLRLGAKSLPCMTRTYGQTTEGYQETTFDIDSGKISAIYTKNKEGQTIKTENYNSEIGTLESIWEFDRFDSGIGKGSIKEARTYDCNYVLQEREVYDEAERCITYDRFGNVIKTEVLGITNNNSGIDYGAPVEEIPHRDIPTYFKYKYDDVHTVTEELKPIIEKAVKKLRDNISINTWITDKNLIVQAEKIINQKLDEILKEKDLKRIVSEMKEVVDIQTKDGVLYKYVENDTPDCEIDKATYQGDIGDCWLLATINSISESGEAGKQFIKNCLDYDEKTQTYTVKLKGGKIQYKIPLDELKNQTYLSFGDYALRAMEYGVQKYFKEYAPYGDNDIEGDWEWKAFETLCGNNALSMCKYNERDAVLIDDEYVDFDIKNIEKLKGHPIKISKLTLEMLKKLTKFKGRIAITANSSNALSAHAFYVKNINENSIEVKEPNNTSQYAVYSLENFIKTYDYKDITIFIP